MHPIIRVPTAQGKQEKWPNKICVRQNTGNLKISKKLLKVIFAAKKISHQLAGEKFALEKGKNRKFENAISLGILHEGK